MKYSLLIPIIIILGCQTQNNKQENNKIDSKVQTENTSIVKSVKKVDQEEMSCNAEVCLQLRNHDKLNKSFDIYMLNSVPVAGFQCDLEGINILQSKGGMLDENGYQTSNSAARILSFSMQGNLIPVGEGWPKSFWSIETTY